MNPTDQLGVGLYGTNGHQLKGPLPPGWGAEIVAVAGFADPPLDVASHASLDALLGEPRGRTAPHAVGHPGENSTLDLVIGRSLLEML